MTTASIRHAMNELVKHKEDRTCGVHLYYFDKGVDAGEKDIEEAIGRYEFSNFKHYKLKLKDKEQDKDISLVGGLDVLSENDFLTCDVTCNGATVHGVPLTLFNLESGKHATWSTMNGIPLLCRDRWGEGRVNEFDICCTRHVIQLEKGYHFQRLAQDDVGSSVVNAVNAFLAPQRRPSLKFSYVGKENCPLPKCAQQTLLIIPDVNRVYAKRTVKRSRKGKEKISFSVAHATFFLVKRWDKAKGQFDEGARVRRNLLHKMEPFHRYTFGGRYSGERYNSPKVSVEEEFLISLCDENGNNEISLNSIVDIFEYTGNIENLAGALFTQYEFGDWYTGEYPEVEEF